MEARLATSIVIDAGCPRSKFRQEQNAFKKDTIITKGPPKHLSGAQIVDMLNKLTLDPERPWYFKGYGETHNWTHKYALWELLYMSVLILMHNILMYNVDEEPPCRDLSIFASRGTTIGSSTSYYSTLEKGRLPCYTCMLT
jgi:hypothetical protein